jgi:hypothetical protein
MAIEQRADDSAVQTLGKASYFCSGCHSATTASPSGKLRIRRPSGLAGPQPQQALLGAYFSWSDSFIVLLEQASNLLSRSRKQRCSRYPCAPFGDRPLYGRCAGPA